MKRTNRQGEWWVNNDGENLHIIEYNGVNDCTIEFEDGTIVKHIQYHNIVSGGIKNNNRKSVFGVGYIGYGIHKASIKSKHTKCYSIWRGMLQRCYYQYKEFNVSYENVDVCNEWHNFQNFAPLNSDNGRISLSRRYFRTGSQPAPRFIAWGQPSPRPRKILLFQLHLLRMRMDTSFSCRPP